MVNRLDILLYLIRRHYSLHGKLYGRKKLQKLLFLVEHLNPATGKLTRSSGATGYRFIIWLYGPFSREIYTDLERLEDEGLVNEEVVSGETTPRFQGLNMLLYEDDGTPKVIYIYTPRTPHRRLMRFRVPVGRSSEAVNLPTPVRKRIDYVLERYGHMNGTQLEQEVLRMLKLTPEKKMKYMYRLVDEYIVNEIP